MKECRGTVVHICLASGFNEGFEYQENVLTRKHSAFGYDTYVISSRTMLNKDNKKSDVEIKNYTNKDNVKVVILPYKYDNWGEFGKKYSRKYYLYQGLYKQLERISPDIIFCHSVQFYSLHDLIRYVKRNKNVKLYVDSHSDYRTAPVKTWKRYLRYRYIWGRQFRRIERFCEKIWCTHPGRIIYMNEIYGVTSEKVDLLVMGGDVKELTPQEREQIRSQVRKKYNISEDVFLIVTGGKIDREKNIHLVLEAFSKMKNKNVELVVFGKPVSQMQNEIEKYSNIRNIKIVGWLTSGECYDFFYAADLGIFPGTHSVLWEQAVACGLPCVFKSTRGEKHIDLGGNCALIEDINTENIFKTINNIIDNRQAYDNMKKIALEKGFSTFSYDSIAKKGDRNMMRQKIEQGSNIYIIKRFIKENILFILTIAIISSIYSFTLLYNIGLLNNVIVYTVSSESDMNILVQIFTEQGIDEFVAILWLFIIVSIFTGIISIINNVVCQKVIVRIIKKYETMLIDKFSIFKYSYFVSRKQGELLYATTSSTQGMASCIQNISDLIKNIVTLVFLIVYMCFLSFTSLFLVIIAGIIYMVIFRKYILKVINSSAKKRTESKEAKNVVFNEFVTWIKTIKSYGKEHFWREKYINKLSKELSNYYKLIIYNRIPSSIMSMMTFLIIGIIGLVMYYSSSGDILSVVDDFAIIGLVLYKILAPAQGTNTAVQTIIRFVPEMKIVYGLIDEKQVEEYDCSKLEYRTFENSIAFRDVSFTYDDIEYVLKNININIEKNQTVAFVGSSGAGKTTITNLITKLSTVKSGNVYIDDVNLNDIDKVSYLNKIGYVGQEVCLLNDTVENNVIFGRKGISIDDVKRACVLAHADEFITGLSNGYKTIVGDSGSKLSGGQRQRITIARAIVNDPDIIIFDEATSALDNISEKIVKESINSLSGNTTTIIIAHRLSTIVGADMIYVMDKGEIVESGTHEELIKNSLLYKKLYEISENSKEDL